MRLTFVSCLSLVLLLLAVKAVAAVPVNPTAQNQLPDAVLGKAGPPQGRAVNYYQDNSLTQGYLAVPEGSSRRGAVILIHEWNGLVDRVRQVADGFAAEGYVALAVDLYSGRTGSNREENMALVRESLSDMDGIVANLRSAVDFLRSRPDVNGKVAAIGWCYGGGVALSFALGSDSHEGTAIFYGRLLADPEQLGKIHHEVYGTFAEMDSGIPPASVHAFVATLREAGVANDVHIYDDVRHGFWLHVDREPETNRGPALDAWQRLKRYLHRTLSN